VSVSTTLFLLLHTQLLTARIDEIQAGIKQQPSSNPFTTTATISDSSVQFTLPDGVVSTLYNIK
jgi:hypothetical protein